MAHIHTEHGQHDHTVSFFIIRTDFSEPKLILHKHKKIGKLMMFGGHIELNETPWQAAAHEIVEETGYDHSQLQILQPARRITKLTGSVLHPVPVVSSTGVYPGEILHYHSDSAYAMIANSEPANPIGEYESADIRMVTLTELRELSTDTILENWREVGVEILSYYLDAWVPVPLSDFEK